MLVGKGAGVKGEFLNVWEAWLTLLLGEGRPREHEEVKKQGEVGIRSDELGVVGSVAGNGEEHLLLNCFSFFTPS